MKQIGKRPLSVTFLDPRLEGTFRVWSFPDILMRIHPNCDGLICNDNEVVVQSQNGSEWLDFVREDQKVILDLLVPVPVIKKEDSLHCPDCGDQTLGLIETTEPDGTGEYKECRTCYKCENIVYIVRHK